MRVGVLAIQGGFHAHARALTELGLEPVEVRAPSALDRVEGLVLPGGESTAQLRLIDWLALEPALDAVRERELPVLATCAGLILVAHEVRGPVQRSLGWLDVDVHRNGFGRQKDSFDARSDCDRYALRFIRAPRIVRTGPDVTVLATWQGEPVLVRQGHVTAATYHPELTGQLDIHREAFGARRALAPVA